MHYVNFTLADFPIGPSKDFAFLVKMILNAASMCHVNQAALRAALQLIVYCITDGMCVSFSAPLEESEPLLVLLRTKGRLFFG